MKLRAIVRLLRVALHLSRGVLTVALRYPYSDENQKLILKQRWSAQLVALLGLSLEYAGTPSAAGLVVANHISFIDVFAINAVMPSSFVAKDEVRRWPLIGWLATRTDTLFLERGSRGAAQRTRQHMEAHLGAGKCIAVFPEGTTSTGDAVLPFHSAMFQAAIDAGVDIVPVAVAYESRNGDRSFATAFIGDMSLLQCLWSIACADGITAKLSILPAHVSTGCDRRHLSAHAHRAIAHHLNRSSLLSVPDTATETHVDLQAVQQ